MIADNFNLDIHTPNGKAATHSLAIIEFSITHYNGTEEAPLVQVHNKLL